MFISELSGSVYDTVVIGTGPAGITVATELAARQKGRVLLVESGTLKADNPAQRWSAAIDATGDLPASYYPRHAQRVFGGTSTVWAGYCAAFEARSFNQGEWPISHGDVAPHYVRAAEILQLPANAAERPFRPVPGTAELVYRPYFLSPPVRFNLQYGDLLREHSEIDVLLGATCDSIEHQNGRAASIRLVDSASGDALSEVPAHRVVLACGGLGNPYLLQRSVLSESPALGRYFMEHPHIYQVGEIALDPDVLGPLLESGNVVHALSLSDQTCEAEGLLNFTVDFKIDKIQDVAFLGRRRPMYVCNASIRSEMKAMPDNHMEIMASEGHLGLPDMKVHLDFAYQNMARRCWAHFSQALLRSRIGRPVTGPAGDYTITGGGHYIGTTRMGFDESDSVVDGNCRVHGMENVFVAGSSVFSAGAAANPTFSIVALAVRLAEHLSGSGGMK